MDIESKLMESIVDHGKVATIADAAVTTPMIGFSGTAIPLRCFAFIISLSDINAVSQSFRAKLHCHVIRALSKEELLLYESLSNKLSFDPIIKMCILPHVTAEVISNDAIIHNNGKNYSIGFDDEFESISLEYVYTIDCIFLESFELINFPFDLQHLEIIIEFKSGTLSDKYGYYPMNINLHNCGIQMGFGSSNITGWDFIGLEMKKRDHTKIISNQINEKFAKYIKNSDNNNKFNCKTDRILQECNNYVHFRMKMRRQYKFFLSRVGVVLGIISFLTMACFLFGNIEESIADRFGYISGMLLTAVAYMFITISFIPALNYWTLLDKYVYFTFFFIFCIGLITGILYLLSNNDNDDNDDNDNDNDTQLLIICVIFWFIAHIYFIICSYIAYNQESKKIPMSKEQVEEYVKLKNKENNNNSQKKAITILAPALQNIDIQSMDQHYTFDGDTIIAIPKDKNE